MKWPQVKFNSLSLSSLGWLGLLGILFCIGFTRVRHDDPFMYFSIAREYFRTGVFSDIDPFVWAPPNGSTWDVMHATGGFLLFYVIYLIGGWAGLAVLKLILGFTAFAPSFISGFRHWRGSLWHYAILLCAMITFSIRFADRTSLIADALLALALWVAISDWQGSPRVRWFFPLIVLAWINVHGSFPLCWMICGLWLGCYLLTMDFRGFWQRTPVFIASLLIAFLNRRGWEGIMQPFRFREFQKKYLEKFVYEWEPTFQADKWLAHEVKLYALMLVLVFALFLLSFYQEINKKKIFYAVMAVVLALISVKAIRFISVGAIGLSLLSMNLPVRVPPLSLKYKPWLAWVSGLLMSGVSATLLAFMLTGNYTMVGMKLVLGYGPTPVRFNESVVTVLKYLPERGPVLANFDFGCYLAWQLDGKKKFFMHGFVTDLRIVKRYFEAVLSFQTIERFDKFVDLYGINEVLIKKKDDHNANETMRNNPKWKLMAEDDTAMLYERIR